MGNIVKVTQKMPNQINKVEKRSIYILKVH